MFRILTLALALAAAPAWAAGPAVSVEGATVAGNRWLPGVGPGSCGAGGRATVHVTFSDPQGIAYAAIDLGSVGVRPVITDQERAWTWIPDYGRPDRRYRWRYEDQGPRLSTRHTIPVEVNFVPGAGPVPVEVMAADGAGSLTNRFFRVMPAGCR